MAGHLERDGVSIWFQYDPGYVQSCKPALSLSLPLQLESFEQVGQLTAYFSGLVSEGWLRRVQAFEQRIHPADEFTLLINNGRDLAGAETILPV
ncbi:MULTISPECIES: HipA N-terminal domain-containing protein [Marinobacter]|uniref:HipA N-terminal domain-containing protein n=1 Tax=Marinobacter TaxID=2742 RepID=UPI001B01EDF2|nr:HipA N-terminal domain-containing protein [Marinobacter sp.]MBO6875629.1 HipA N-terminal domain-containing protein [Marinobacter sp.]